MMDSSHYIHCQLVLHQPQGSLLDQCCAYHIIATKKSIVAAISCKECFGGGVSFVHSSDRVGSFPAKVYSGCCSWSAHFIEVRLDSMVYGTLCVCQSSLYTSVELNAVVRGNNMMPTRACIEPPW